jgi:L-ribulose-5-phosphate 3-epimerase
MLMKISAGIGQLGVCSWSLQPRDPRELVAKLLATGISRIQLALDPLVEAPAVWGETARVLQQADIRIVSGMFGCAGEDYSTIDSIRLTGGIAPDATWEQNLKRIRAAAVVADVLGLKIVTFHAGFVPPNRSDPGFAKMLKRLGVVADIFAAKKIMVGLETGQETAAELATLLVLLKRLNVGVNFDPANMLLYGQGDPIQALRLLGPWICQVHIKDALRTQVPGTWGSEVAAGSGEVNWLAFFTVLSEVNFTGALVIEREAGARRCEDIRAARELVLKLNG